MPNSSTSQNARKPISTRLSAMLTSPNHPLVCLKSLFKIGFVFSDEEGSGIEFYSNHDLPDDVSEKLGALAIDFINKIGDLVLPTMH
jgi:hypothetical protein